MIMKTKYVAGKTTHLIMRYYSPVQNGQSYASVVCILFSPPTIINTHQIIIYSHKPFDRHGTLVIFNWKEIVSEVCLAIPKDITQGRCKYRVKGI